MANVDVSRGERDQPLQRLSDQLSGSPAEHRFERAIRGHDRAVPVHRDDPLRGGFEQQPQLAIARLVPARLELFLDPAALRDVQLEAGEPRHLSVDVAIGAPTTLNPRDRPVWQDDSERVVPRVLALRALDFAEEREHMWAILFVHAAQPGLEGGWFLGVETVAQAEPLI